MSGSVMVAARRSAIVPRGGAFSRLELHELGVPVLLAALADAGMTARRVDEVIVANALGGGGNPARVIALAAGLPAAIGGLTIDRQCTGGLDAILLADALIRSGQAKIVIAGGVESYSRRPLRARRFTDGRPPEPYEQPYFTPWPDRETSMAEAAQRLADRFGITRALQDEWAMASHAKARAHHQARQAEIVAINDLADDPFTRALSPAHCRRAKPVFGDITAATMAVAADAAAFSVIMSAELARAEGLDGLRVISGVSRGGDPDWPGLAPVAAITTALTQAQLSPADLHSVEIMEAFAAQAMACQRESGFDDAQTNPAGGALAQGHPIGASGTILATRLFHRLKHDGGTGAAAIAAAGGLGSAIVLGQSMSL